MSADLAPLELLLQRAISNDIFGLQHMCHLGWPNQYLNTALPEDASGGGLVRTFKNIQHMYCPIDVWGPCLPSAVPPGGGNP